MARVYVLAVLLSMPYIFTYLFNIVLLPILHDSMWLGKMYPPIHSNKGLVVVTDATERIGKELSYYLSEDLGMFVLGGKSYERSALYTYELHKGIEAISMRLDEPKDIAATFYRIKELNRDLKHRPLVSIIINQLDISSSSSRSFNQVFGLEQFENIYKSRLKGLIRVMDMGTDLLLNSTAGSSSSSLASTSRGRLIILSCKETSQYRKGCGSSCLLDSIIHAIGDQINEDYGMSVSTIFIPCSTSLSYDCEKRSLKHALLSRRPQRKYLC